VSQNDSSTDDPRGLRGLSRFSSDENGTVPLGENRLFLAKRRRLLERHRWLAPVLPMLVYMLVGALEPSPGHPGGARLGLAIPYSAYPLLYALKIGVTLVAIALVWPGYVPGGDDDSGKKGTAPICANHPSGRSGKWGLSPFSLSAWPVSPLAIAVGAVGIVVWVGLCKLGLDVYLLKSLGLGSLVDLGDRPGFNPFKPLSGYWLWLFLAVRFLGLAAVVPMIEETFLRSFVMRFVMAADWWKVPFGKLNAAAVLTALAYAALTHPAELLAAVAWFGMVTWLMARTRNLWDCIAAHAVTNLLLGFYVLATRQWSLW
jgi:uncharacterized protein